MQTVLVPPADAAPRPLVLLIHGLGTTGAVWDAAASALERQHGADVLAPDLPGHGAARAAAPYTLGGLAAAMAAALAGCTGSLGAGAGATPSRPVLVAGHSLGGYVALALASGWFGFAPCAAMSLGARLSFDVAERARAAAVAARPVRYFATQAEAVARYRLVAGLAPEQAPDARCLERGVVREERGFRLATDPAAFGIVVPEFAALLAAARCPVLVARGEHDALVSRAQCERLGTPTAQLAGLGHNAHVEDPARLAALIAGLLVGQPMGVI